MNQETIQLSIIVIGRNEGEKLKPCLDSTTSINFPKNSYEIIYVDSASTDNSVEIARNYPITIIETKPVKPTPGLARNEGVKVAKGKYLFFLDGDTILDPNFVENALPYLSEQRTAVVCGRLEEVNLENSIYHKILNLDWNFAPGFVDSCGGTAIFNRTVFDVTNGFDNELNAGEEPDLCRRLRGLGWKILNLDIPMALHDLNMQHFSEYWKRSVRTGYAYAEISNRYAKTNDPLWKKESNHNLLKIFVFFMLLMVTSIAMWLGGLKYFILLPIIIGFFIAKKTYSTYKKIKDFPLSLYYGIHCHFQHIPLFIGQLKYFIEDNSK